jgi:hypothetical protein
MNTIGSSASGWHGGGLLLSALLTIVWGGSPGGRPGFILTSSHGRGSGKTTTAEAMAHVFGGSINFTTEERDERLLSRLLSLDARHKRIVLFDNVKRTLSNPLIESLMTSCHWARKTSQ